MADFRKLIYVFAVLALVFGSTSTANAQPTAAFQCIANAGVPPLMRSEGLTELTGDLVLNCQGGTPLPGVTGGAALPAGQVPPTVNIRMFLNTQVTSRLIAPTPNSEALLLLDEPGTGTAIVLCPPGTTVVGTVLCNAYQGRVSGNFVEFLGIPVLPPAEGATRVYRVTNVRANANMVSPGAGDLPGQIIGLVSATPATPGLSGAQQISASFPINNPQQILGFVQRGLTFSVLDPGGSALATAFGFQQCIARPLTAAGRAAAQFARLRFAENFATAFKTRTTQGVIAEDATPPMNPQNVPGFVYNTESGYYNPAIPTIGATAGLADFGTRLRAVFTNVPAGVRLFVSTNQLASSTGGLTARLVLFETGAFFPVTPFADQFGTPLVNVAEVPLVGGTGTVVWEVINSNALAAGVLDFGLYATFAPDLAANLPAAPGQSSIAGSFAPISTVGTASATAPIPRFADTAVARNLFRINVCVTNLLFPFVTNQVGFDTGLAISNTSQDPFGTAAQAGTCTLNAYGANAPAAITTPSVAAGTVYTALASGAMPNFQGYVIAQCRFQYAHGFAFISDLGARNLAMGYLALVIPDPARSPSPFPLAGAGSGEQLGF